MEVEPSRGISALLRRDGRAGFPSPPCPYEDTGRRAFTSQVEKHGTDHYLGVFRRSQTCQHLDLRRLASRTERKYISVV